MDTVIWIASNSQQFRLAWVRREYRATATYRGESLTGAGITVPAAVEALHAQILRLRRQGVGSW